MDLCSEHRRDAHRLRKEVSLWNAGRREAVSSACFRASTRIGTAHSARGDGRAACNSHGDRPTAAVLRPSRAAFIRLISHLFIKPPFHSHSCGVTEQQEVARSGGGGSTGAGAVCGRFTAGLRVLRVCDGSAGRDKTGQGGERGRGTTVPRHETGRRHLGTVPRHGDPCLASCLAINDRW